MPSDNRHKRCTGRRLASDQIAALPPQFSWCSMFIVASINGTAGQGFAEAVMSHSGSADRLGLLKLTAPNARKLQASIERKEPLVYNGPVATGAGWRLETLTIVAMRLVIVADGSATVHIEACAASSQASVAA